MTFLFTPATFPGYNKNDKNNSNNGNSGNNGNGNLENNNSNSQKDKMGKGNSNGDIELISMLSTAGNDELISEVDTYLLNLFSITDDKSNNGNNGNNSGGSSENSNANNNGNGSDNSNKNPGDNSNANNSNSNNNGNGNGNNGNDNGNNGNGNNSSNQSDNGKNTDNGNNSENGNGNSNAWKDIGAKVDQGKANGKTKDHANKGYDKNTNANGKGYANGKNKDKSNNGKHVGWDKNDNPNTPNDPYDMINPDIFEFTGYINDINQEYTEVLMTTDSEGNYRGAYTYANGERISVEDLGQVEGVPNDPLYYLYDALGTTAAITNMNAGIIDNNRFAPFGEPLSPVAKNSRLTNSPWGYTGESHDIEAEFVYLRARNYEPGSGRFIQQDSYPYFGEIEEPLTRNLYIYGNGNPLKYIDPSGHMNYITQSDSLMKDVFRGLGDWAKDILNSPNALVQLAKNIIFGDITIADMVSAGFADFVEKYNYVKNNIGILSPLKKASDEAVEEIGYRIGMIVGDVVISIVGAKLVSAFSKTKLGQKLIDKFKNLDTATKSGSKVIFKSTDDAASLVAKNLDGTLSELKNGYKIEIPNGNKPIVVRIMNEGSGGRANPYFRVSIDGKGSLTLDGVLSTDRALTHIDMTDDFLSQITDMIKKYQGK